MDCSADRFLALKYTSGAIRWVVKHHYSKATKGELEGEADDLRRVEEKISGEETH